MVVVITCIQDASDVTGVNFGNENLNGPTFVTALGCLPGYSGDAVATICAANATEYTVLNTCAGINLIISPTRFSLPTCLVRDCTMKNGFA